MIRRYAAITKTEDNGDGTIQVFGIASTEGVDSQGETVTKGAMQDALPDYFRHGTGALRSMHQPIAAGFVSKAEINAAGETEITATVVDPVEVLKVQTGVYLGFSIGGKKLPGGYDAITKTITKMKLTEISLVDRPANPEATITMWKGDDMTTETTEAVVPATAVAAVDALADILNKGTVTPERLVELANAEMAPAPVSTATAATIAKGMYNIGEFAALLSSLGWLTSDAQWEAACEGDGSPIPAALRAWLADGAKIFEAMASEEVAELIASLQPPAAASLADTADAVVVEIAMSDTATTLRKSLTEAAAVSLIDYMTIGKAHMAENDIAKAVLADGFDKTTDAIVAALSPDVAKLAAAGDTIAKLETERDELIAKVARLEAQPAPTNATLRVVVEKSDVTPATVEAAPILKADGSVDPEATALDQIKKLHQTGGHSLRSFI